MITLLLLAGLAMSPDIEPPPKYKVRVEDHEVWVETADGEKRVVFDALAAEPAAVSPNGDRVVYAVDNPNGDCNEAPRQYIALVSNQGSPIWKVALDNCNEFNHFEWIDEHRIGAKMCGHANCFYWVLDAATGKTLQQLSSGFDFLWSHNRQLVAHHIPFYNEESGSSLYIGEREVNYPKRDVRTGQLPVVDIGELTWSPDDKWISFPETDYPSYDSYVVLVSPRGEVLRESLPVDVEYSNKVVWTDSSHFQITTSKRTFYFVVEGGKLREIAAPALH